MKVSFDGLRRNIAKDFNNLVGELRELELHSEFEKEQVSRLGNELRCSLGCLLSCYDKNQQPDDFNDLSDLELEEL